MSLFIIVSMANFVIYGKYRKINHFDDIAVCEAFDEYATKKQIKDKYITDIDFVDSYVKELKYKGKRFTIYAYQFKDDETAKEYYSRVVSVTTDKDIEYWFSAGPFSSYLIAKYKNKCLPY